MLSDDGAASALLNQLERELGGTHNAQEART
jgi:hypothetical protein